MDKQLIAERFARARATYSREARVQQQVAEKMIRLLQRNVPDAGFDRIAEFGCGTRYCDRKSPGLTELVPFVKSEFYIGIANVDHE